MSTDQQFDMQPVLDKTMPLYIDRCSESQFMNSSMCRALVRARKSSTISAAEFVSAQIAIDEFLDHASRNQDDPDSFLIHVLAESGCENPAETALRIYQNWDERMTILHEATDKTKA